MDYSVLKKRYIGLDILRIISAAAVCMFHTTIHLGCDYGIIQGLSKSGSVFMTAFFMLSGFTLFTNWGGENLTDISVIKGFYKKRVLSIIPVYLFATLLFDIAHIIIGGQSFIKTILLAPIEAVGVQSFYTSLFSQSHNGGTWFISCILFCYFLFPLLHLLITKCRKKAKVKILFALVAILLYSPIICYVFDLSNIYSNPLFRCMEFMIGIILASFKVDYIDSKLLKIIYNNKTVICISIMMVIMISIAVKLGISVGNAMLYNWICLPCFSIIVLGLSGLEFDRIKESKAVKQLSAISYVFFLAQLFSNDICKFVIRYFGIDSNIVKILLGWIVCIFLAIVLRICELVINKHIMAKFFIDYK